MEPDPDLGFRCSCTVLAGRCQERETLRTSGEEEEKGQTIKDHSSANQWEGKDSNLVIPDGAQRPKGDKSTPFFRVQLTDY